MKEGIKKSIRKYIRKYIRKSVISFLLLCLLGGLTACASDTQTAPCAGYGKWCTKTPINSWDYGKY